MTTSEVCRNCGHSEEDHPNHFLCEVVWLGGDGEADECRCPGWVKKVEGIN